MEYKHAGTHKPRRRILLPPSRSHGMVLLYQTLDIVIAGILAGVTTFALATVAPNVAVSVGVLAAGLYYFSRNPWGGNGEEVNEAIDDVYARLLRR